MCWAAADRMHSIAVAHRLVHADEFAAAASRIREEILTQAVDETRGCLVGEYHGKEVDAALLQAVTLRLLPTDDPCMAATVEAIRSDLQLDGWLKRYRTDDGFGIPSVAFTLCTFRLVEALARLGRDDDARAVLDRIHAVQSPLGLLSDDVDPTSGMMWGNFPQAYSHVGLIRAAFAAAPRWSEFGG